MKTEHIRKRIQQGATTEEARRAEARAEITKTMEGSIRTAREVAAFFPAGFVVANDEAIVLRNDGNELRIVGASIFVTMSWDRAQSVAKRFTETWNDAGKSGTFRAMSTDHWAAAVEHNVGNLLNAIKE